MKHEFSFKTSFKAGFGAWLGAKVAEYLAITILLVALNLIVLYA